MMESAPAPAAAARGKADRHRRCLVTGAACDPADLIRYVVGPDSVVVPDVAGTLPGRGLWVGARRDLVEQACQRGRFERAAGRRDRSVRLVVNRDLADQTERLLHRRCLDFVGLARRAGLAELGEDKVAVSLRQGRAAVVIIAADAGGAGRAKLRRLAAGTGAATRFVICFDGTALGAAVGRDYTGYVSLRAGALADRFLAEVKRLNGFRDDAVATAPGGGRDEGSG